MYNENFFIHTLRDLIVNSDVESIMELLCLFEEDAKDTKILLFGIGKNKFPSQHLPIVTPTDKFSIDSVNGKDNFFWIDLRTSKEMLLSGTGDLKFNQCINLDTQVVSYMMRLFRSKDIEKNEFYNSTYKIMKYLLENKFDYSAYPYMLENSYKLETARIPIFEAMGVFEYIKNSDVEKFKNHFLNNDVNYINIIDVLHTDDTIKLMERMSNETNKLKFQQSIKCLLLKTASLSLNTKLAFEEKASKLFQFSHDTLNLFLERELAICLMFLKNSNDPEIFSFFKKIRKGNKKILSAIEGMAWDLLHIRELATSIFKNYTLNSEQEFDMHSLLTFDRGLSEVLAAYPVKGLLSHKGELIWVFESSIEDITSANIRKYYTDEMIDERRNAHRNIKLKDILHKLEHEISSVQLQ